MRQSAGKDSTLLSALAENRASLSPAPTRRLGHTPMLPAARLSLPDLSPAQRWSSDEGSKPESPEDGSIRQATWWQVSASISFARDRGTAGVSVTAADIRSGTTDVCVIIQNYLLSTASGSTTIHTMPPRLSPRTPSLARTEAGLLSWQIMS